MCLLRGPRRAKTWANGGTSVARVALSLSQTGRESFRTKIHTTTSWLVRERRPSRSQQPPCHRRMAGCKALNPTLTASSSRPTITLRPNYRLLTVLSNPKIRRTSQRWSPELTQLRVQRLSALAADRSATSLPRWWRLFTQIRTRSQLSNTRRTVRVSLRFKACNPRNLQRLKSSRLHGTSSRTCTGAP